jgi:hypothetical protein
MVVFRTLALLCLSFLGSVAAIAGAPQQEVVKAQRANAAALREYSWKSRTELSLKGETRNVRLEQVRYDLAGRLQKTLIGGQSQDSGSGRTRSEGPLRQRVIAKKQEDFRDLMNDLAALADSYAHLPPDRIQAFATHATFTKREGIEAGLVRINGRSVPTAGDEMVVWIDPVSAMTRTVEIRTALESKAVHLVADYRSLHNGLTYQARSVLRYPDEQLNLTVENFDRQFEGRRR